MSNSGVTLSALETLNASDAMLYRELRGLPDFERAFDSPTLFAGTPEHCDICGCEISDFRFFADCETQSGRWAYLCPDCHDEQGAPVGWGEGQIYMHLPELGGWVLVAGLPPTGHAED